MKKLLLLGIMLLGMGGVTFAAKTKVSFSSSNWWAQASWDAGTSTMSWDGVWAAPSGGNGTWYFIETNIPAGDISSYTYFHATLSDFSDNVDYVLLRVKQGDNNYADVKLVAGENNIDLKALAAANPGVNFKNVTDVTIWGSNEALAGKVINAENKASVKIQDVYLQDNDNSNHYLKISTNSKKANAWEWAIKYKLDAPLEKGKTYTLSMLAKSTSKINPDNGNIWFWPSGKDQTPTYTGYYIGTEWGKCTCDFTAADNHEYLIWDFGPFEGDIYFDDITLVEKGQSTNLMEDDFEDGLSSKWCDDSWNKPVYKVVSEKEDIDRQPINIVAEDKNFSVWSKEYPKNTSSQVSADGDGVYAVKAVAKVSNTWDTQVWISASQDLPVGSLYTIEFACKASEAVQARAQIHGKADGNNYRYDLQDKDFPTDWTNYKIEGQITDNRGGKSLAFNLSQEGKDVTYYFKDIKVTVTVDENTATAINGNTTITIGEKGSRTYCSNHALDFSGVDGLKAYVASAFDPNHSNVTMTEVTKVPANTGLYLVGTAGDYNVPVASEAATIGTNMLVGISSTEGDYVEATEGEYVNLVLATTAAGRGFHPLSKSGKMGNNKAYLHVTSTDFAKLPSEAPLRITIEDEEATGIEEVATPIVADGVWYTINGVKLAGEPTEKGIYIFNGKKVAIQ